MKLDDFGFLADENLHPEVVAFLRQHGCEVRTAAEMHLLGAADSAVMRAAVSEDRVVVTHDGDFGRLAIATGEPFVGIVLLRPGHLDPVFTIRALERLFAADLDLTVPFTIVVHRRGNKVRIRMRRGI